MSVTYRIPDEPVGGQSFAIVVDPFWALLGAMFGGAWLGAALFAMNAWYLRGPMWQRELALVAAMFVGAVLLGVLIHFGEASGVLPERAVKYAALAVIAWKLAIMYWIYFLQQAEFALFEYFGGKLQNGALFVVLGSLLLRPLVTQAFDHPLWWLMVS
jgi:hypothetical protein